MSATVWLHLLWLIAICTVGDLLFKRAALQPQPWLSGSFIAGSLIYGLCGFSWVIVLKTAKLAISGVIFSVLWSVCLAVCGVIFFGEHLSAREVLGLALGMASLLLLSL